MNLQGADNKINDKVYKLTLPYIKDGDSILNLGCGINFVFEETISKLRKVSITSVDILPITKKPRFIKEVITQSVEEPFLLKKRVDVVTFFEVIEHIDKTDVLLRNCFDNLKDRGFLILSFPNLASIYSRFELMLGFQPHILETSNEIANFGTGIFGHMNSIGNQPLHHIRGITSLAMKQMLEYRGFKIVKIIGYEWRFKKLFYFFPSIAPINVFICQKKRRHF